MEYEIYVIWKLKKIFMEIENMFEDLLLVQDMKHEDKKYCTIHETWK